MRRIYWVILLFFLYSCPGPLAAIEGLRFENINTKNGLSHNTARYIMQDKRGFIWISTTNGLNRYDGREFTIMLPEFGIPSLTEGKIRRTLEDHQGRIWIHSTSGIVSCYDTHLESFVDYTGRNEDRNYLKVELMPGGDVWLWGNINGACHIRYNNGVATPTLYDISNIGTNTVNFVYKDSDRQIWLGTDKGLLKINGNTSEYCFTGGGTPNFHSAVELGKNIYFFTKNNKIIVFDKLRKTYLYDIIISPTEKNLVISQTASLDESRILITGRQATHILDINQSKVTTARDLFDGDILQNSHIFIDNKENRWVYNKSGYLWLYKTENHSFEKFEMIPKPVLSVIDLERYEIYCDSRNIAWITTYGNGLFALELNTGKLHHFTHANSGLRTNYLLTVSEDQSGEIWVGTEHTGISKISLTNYKNKIFFPDADKANTENMIIRTIYEDKNGDIWIGAKSGNIYIFDKNFKQKNKYTLPLGMPYCLMEDTIGNKWVGTKSNGLQIISGDGDLLEAHVYNSNNDEGISNNNIYSILRDSKGNMWLGTFGGGLIRCERKNNKLVFRRFTAITNKQKLIRCITQDSSGQIWVGGNNGIIVFDPDEILKNENNFRSYSFDKNNPNSLNNNEVKSIFEDSHNQIWIGTSGGGLNMAVNDPAGSGILFKHYSSNEGIINNVVQAILEDNERNLWLSTESGISKFNTSTKVFENYSFSDVWESDLFCESSCFKRNNGELLFGSYKGMYIFNTSLIETSSHSTPVTITRLSINGAPITPNTPDSPLSKSITETKLITLKNGQNSFSIEFSSLNFQDASSNRYIYILENYDKTWNPVTQYNVATYKNIPDGKYTFKVKGSNNSGVWSEYETTLEIVIVPPFWKSWQAFALYFILATIIIFFAAKLALKMNKLHNDVEVEKQLTEYRLRFFTNISHEFRTPLTIIQGSIENMMSMTPLPLLLKKQVEVLDKSSSRLMRLIDQLLEFRKLQNNKMELRLEHTEAVGFFGDIYKLFTETAGRKNIDFTFSSDETSKVILLDRGKMDKIAFNLLSNAFKHTPENGSIKMEILFDPDKDVFSLEVSDSGIGIPKEKRDQLFVRFKQINYSSSGMGIGLHLTSELVNVHKGKIEYSDSQWGGASFKVTVPLTDTAYAKEDIVAENELPVKHLNGEENKTPAQPVAGNSLKTYKILIIEDDEEIRAFVENQLDEFFTIFTAPNGLAGLEAAIAKQPDLIICDVMMPEMDGFEVTKKLKADFQSSHIPIILLTAHSSMEHQIEGIEAGADSYIIKPFSTKYLMMRIVKLIEQREKLQHKFAHEPGMIQTTICTSRKDNEFIQKIHSIIEENIENPNFSVDDFAQSIHLGRTIFYKKIKSITGYSPNGYLRIIRLKKAAELIRTTDMNVSEIAYKVGFNDPFYFSKCFKEQFGTTPTRFRETNDSPNTDTGYAQSGI